jgi:O-acetyl-ADP-ribose deacetylase (regulator of RNase III)
VLTDSFDEIIFVCFDERATAVFQKALNKQIV